MAPDTGAAAAPVDIWIPDVQVLFCFLLGAGVLFGLITWAVFKLAAPSTYKSAGHAADEHVQVIVMGDIGRSPRMQYHAISFAKHGYNVDLIGYKETARHPSLIGKPNVHLFSLRHTPEWLAWSTGLLVLPIRVLYSSFALFQAMAYRTAAPKWIIIQNPPSIPTFHITLVVAWLRGSKVIIDWHNYGHTIMALNRSKRNPGVIFYRYYETMLGRMTGSLNLTVTRAMARQLIVAPYYITSPILTLYDRPASTFKPIQSAAQRQQLLSAITPTQPHAARITSGAMRLVVSSTSWTPDEDFGLFLEALVSFAAVAPTTELLVIVTGKGLQKAEFERLIAKLTDTGTLAHVTIMTAWLSTADYASLLSCADLGVCLHKSSSGVDLPMKVVDMFGAGIPVAAYSAYESFSELVKDGRNGRGFTTSAELADILVRLMAPGGQAELAKLKSGAVEDGSLGWDEQWDNVLGRALGIVT
ncbi:Chitobiosyldiphosphodolichol beta-mannosyltransferase [Ceratocystis platani]|uniref:Chitobiosyldiphosphodolichol beta-mannosyltransferase n=1 Tax=Ceratocystis fimbriata f. sp. platani TaxID=88771 RepID=A0A0F8BLG3_CERFI|nr:Chitobiosyldiphosphodolichol beta-mannosyltransferase [Ceratocystis platani]